MSEDSTDSPFWTATYLFFNTGRGLVGVALAHIALVAFPALWAAGYFDQSNAPTTDSQFAADLYADMFSPYYAATGVLVFAIIVAAYHYSRRVADVREEDDS